MYNINKASLCGIVENDPVFDHESHGEKFYKFSISVKRDSGIVDVFNCTVSEYFVKDIATNVFVQLVGEWRTYGREVHFFVKECGVTSLDIYINTLTIEGYLVSKPVCRMTRNQVRLSHGLLASNRTKRKGSYLQFVVWGRKNTAIMSECDIGTKILLQGRMEMRNGKNEIRFEISANNMEVLNEEEQEENTVNVS